MRRQAVTKEWLAMVLATFNGGGREAADPWSVAVVEARAHQQLRYVVAAQEANLDLELRFVSDLTELGVTIGGTLPAAVIGDDAQRVELKQRFPLLPYIPAGAAQQVLPFARLVALMAETEQLCRQSQASRDRS